MRRNNETYPNQARNTAGLCSGRIQMFLQSLCRDKRLHITSTKNYWARCIGQGYANICKSPIKKKIPLKYIHFNSFFKFEHTHTHTHTVKVFTNGPGDRGSISGQVIQKTKKWYLLNTQHYKVWIKSKWSNIGKGVALSTTLHRRSN